MGNCPAVDAWAFQTLHQLAELIDAAVRKGHMPVSCEGLPLLSGGRKLRRMTRVWKIAGPMGVERKKGAAATLSYRAPRDRSSMLKEGIQMGSYYADICASVTGLTQMAIAVDCTDGCGRDNMSIFGVDPRSRKTWVFPVMDRRRQIFRVVQFSAATFRSGVAVFRCNISSGSHCFPLQLFA